MFQKLPISFIVPATKKELIERLSRSLRKRFVDYELIPIYEAKSVFEAWKQGLKKASNEYIVFTHQDVEFYCFPNIEEIFNGDVGMVGVAGSKVITRQNPWWFNLKRQCKGLLSGSVYYRIGNFLKIARRYGPYGNVVALDGVCLLTKKNFLDIVGIPKVSWATWDFYDHIICIEYLKKGYKLITAPIKLAHLRLPMVKRRDFEKTKKDFIKEYFNNNSEFSVK